MITLDHTVIYSRQQSIAAHEFADVMGLTTGRIAGPGYDFTAVHVNMELAIYFMDRDHIGLEQHMAFTVDKKTFAQILERLQTMNIAYGSSPFDRENQSTNHDFALQGLFWTNIDGCLFEIMNYG